MDSKEKVRLNKLRVKMARSRKEIYGSNLDAIERLVERCEIREEAPCNEDGYFRVSVSLEELAGMRVARNIMRDYMKGNLYNHMELGIYDDHYGA